MLISLLNDINTLKSTDNATPIELAIMNDEQEYVNLSDYKNINISIGKNGVIYSSITPEVLDDNKTMSFTLDGNLPFGKYILEVNLIKDDDTVHVAPNRGDFPFTIEKSLNELGETVTLMSVQELISDMNEVKTLSEDSNAKVTQAVVSANNAVDVANTADINANNALITAQASITDSNEALDKANQALTNSETAIDTSNTANTNSSNALSNSETALSNSQTAKINSENAVNTANTANTNASEALDKANQAISDSTNAVATANNADTNASDALTNSQNAVATANEAKSLATTADSNATQAKLDSATALSTANNAKTVADQVRSEFDQIVSGNTDAEVINARTNGSGTTFTNVKARLDDSDNRLTQTNTNLSNLQQSFSNADKTTVGLGNVDNTSDLDKPISTATQTALDDKADKLDLQELINEGFLNSYATDVDANGYYTGVTFKRNDSTIYLVSTLSNPDANDYYQTCTWDFYDVDGITITSTKTWTFTYDSNGKIITKEVV